MPISDKKRASDARWKRKNFLTVSCRLYRQDAADFKAYAAARGESVNSLLQGFVAQCLGRPLEHRGKIPPPNGDGEEEQTQDQ